MGHNRTRKLRVLCVDDDPDIRVIVRLSLHLDPDIHALAVGSAAEALNALKSYTFDVVLLDSLMPGIDGVQLLDHIVRSDGSPPIPAIFLTADVVGRTRYVRQGVIGVITKPFDPIRLAAIVRSMVAKVGTEISHEDYVQ